MCLAVEHALFTQLCRFEGFPEEVRAALQKEGILPKKVEGYRCPITQEPMSFAEFREEVLHPVAGKAKFQVGHLNPLKMSPGETDQPVRSGHTADNVGWVTADGNRIQGHLSLAAIRALLRRVSKNYEGAGLV